MTTATTINTMSTVCKPTINTDGGSSLPSPVSATSTTAPQLPILELLLFQLQQHNNNSNNDGNNNINNNNDNSSSEGIPVLSEEERTQLCSELCQLKELSKEAQQSYTAIHATIQEYQQLVLSTHAQVAVAKRLMLQAARESSTNNNATNQSNHTTSLYSNSSSRGSSPPSSPTSPTSYISNSTSMSAPSSRSRSNSFSFGSSSLPNSIMEEDNHHNNNEEEDEETRLKRLEKEHAELGSKLTQLLRDKAAAEETKKRMNDGLLKAKARIKEIEHILEQN